MAGFETDVVVIGAGHNALISANYLAKAGLSILVLEKRHVTGGGSVTEQLTLPNFFHDTFSTGHFALMANPVISGNEIGLAEQGLRYVGHDPLLVVTVDEKTAFTVYRDEQRTAKQIETFSPADARAWLQMYKDWRRMAPYYMSVAASPPGEAPAFPDQSVVAEFQALVERSALDVVLERFQSDTMRAVALWFAIATAQPFEKRGTGYVPLGVPVAWSALGWVNAVGGASRLSEALVGALAERGGVTQVGKTVSRILVEDGRAAGVKTQDGTVYRARRAVLSSIHFADLPKALPAGSLPAAFTSRAETWRHGASFFVVHLALSGTPQARTQTGPVTSVLTGRLTMEGVQQQIDALAHGRVNDQSPWLFAACSSIIDPSRAPAHHHVLKLMTSVPYALRGDPANWAGAKESYADFLIDQYLSTVMGVTRDDVLARSIYTPVDLERVNPSFRRGATAGGEQLPDQLGLNRPVKGWANYRMPIVALYQTGFCTHPGGAIAGWSGRHAAAAILHDLGIDGRAVFSPVAGSGMIHCDVITTA